MWSVSFHCSQQANNLPLPTFYRMASNSVVLSGEDFLILDCANGEKVVFLSKLKLEKTPDGGIRVTTPSQESTIVPPTKVPVPCQCEDNILPEFGILLGKQFGCFGCRKRLMIGPAEVGTRKEKTCFAMIPFGSETKVFFCNRGCYIDYIDKRRGSATRKNMRNMIFGAPPKPEA